MEKLKLIESNFPIKGFEKKVEKFILIFSKSFIKLTFFSYQKSFCLKCFKLMFYSIKIFKTNFNKNR